MGFPVLRSLRRCLNTVGIFVRVISGVAGRRPTR